MSHTPGPWYVHAPKPELPFYVSTNPEDHFAGDVAVLYGKDSGDDASLIAAAPDLLAALEALMPLAEWALLETSPPAIDQPLVNAAHAAINKARGK